MVNWKQESLIWEHKWLFFPSMTPPELCNRVIQVRQWRHHAQTRRFCNPAKWFATWVVLKWIQIKCMQLHWNLTLDFMFAPLDWYFFFSFPSSLKPALLKLPSLLHTLVLLMVYRYSTCFTSMRPLKHVASLSCSGAEITSRCKQLSGFERGQCLIKEKPVNKIHREPIWLT